MSETTKKGQQQLTMKLLDERLKALESALAQSQKTIDQLCNENKELKDRIGRMQKTDEAIIKALQQSAQSLGNTNEAIGTLLHNYARGLVPADEYRRICLMIGKENV